MEKFKNWGSIRKIIILGLIMIWLVGYFYNYQNPNNRVYFVLLGLLVMFVLEHVFTVIISSRTSEFIKSFMFQTSIPIVSLFLVGFLSSSGSINSEATMTLFGLSLGYTTFVVGRKFGSETSAPSRGDSSDTGDS